MRLCLKLALFCVLSIGTLCGVRAAGAVKRPTQPRWVNSAEASSVPIPGKTFRWASGPIHIKVKVARAKLTFPLGLDGDALLVLFHSGWGAELEYYAPFAQKLAKLGFAVLQYDLRCFRLLQENGPCFHAHLADSEADLLPHLLQYVQKKLGSISLDLKDTRILWDQVIVMGHGRGADVAQRQVEVHTWVTAGLLLDPVAPNPFRHYFGFAGTGGAPFRTIYTDRTRCSLAALGKWAFARYSPPDRPGLVMVDASSTQLWRAPSPRWQATYNILCGAGSEPDSAVRARAVALVAGEALDLVAALQPAARASPVSQATLQENLAAYKQWRQLLMDAGSVRHLSAADMSIGIPFPWKVWDRTESEEL